MRIQGVSHSKLAIALLIPTSVFLLFQNCAPVNFEAAAPVVSASANGNPEGDHSTPDPVPQPPPQPQPVAVGSPKITINGGAQFTKEADVMLELASLNASQMKISNEADCSDGVWEDFSKSRGWKLGEGNKQVYVFAKFRNADTQSDCAAASIVHDDIRPTASYVNQPLDFMNLASAEFQFTGKDDGSGVEKFECKVDSGTFADCVSPISLSGLANGTRRAQLRAIDKAGNVSDPVEHPWVIDTAAPVVVITKGPAVNSRSAAAEFQFTVTDSGSGVDPANIVCKWQNPAVSGETFSMAGCSSPKNITGLKEGTYTFEVAAQDRAGNPSNVAKFTWTIDTLPPGAFNVTGITGGTDTTVDALLGTSAQPTVHWSASQDAVSYAVTILTTTGAQACPLRNTGANSHAYLAAECALEDGKEYVARVVASDSVGNMTQTPDFKFKVDLTPPVITIGTVATPADQYMNRQIPFTVTDATSGVKQVTCTRTYNGTTETTDCLHKTKIDYTNLPAGQHSFTITAVDNAGNRVTSPPKTFTVETVELVKLSTTVSLPTKKVDVLFLIDNSGSMDKDRTKLGQKLADFTSKLADFDWQICVTTTEPSQDGALIPFKKADGTVTTSYMIDKTTSDYNNMFLKTVSTPPVKGGNGDMGSGNESGILATNRAVERNDNRCFRSDAAFASIVLSDEDEESTGGFIEYSTSGQYKGELNTKNLPTTAVSTVASVMGAAKVFTFHSLVIKPGDTACYNLQKAESDVWYGRRYDELSKLTSGITGSICSDNFGNELAAYADRIRATLGSISLECTPKAGTPFEVKVNGSVATSNTYQLDGNKLLFTPALVNGTTVGVSYWCQK